MLNKGTININMAQNPHVIQKFTVINKSQGSWLQKLQRKTVYKQYEIKVVPGLIEHNTM
jgi:hypothetical protein